MVRIGSVWTKTDSISYDPLKGYRHRFTVTVVDCSDGYVTIDDHGTEREMSVKTLKNRYTCVN